MIGSRLVLAMFALTMAAGQPASAEASSGIGGVVHNGAGAPLKGICVYAYAANNSYVAGALTSEDGSYTVRGLQQGNYRLLFSNGCNVSQGSAVYLSEFYDDAPDLSSATPVPVDGTATVGGIDAVLATGAKISGRVTDASGTGLDGIEVEVFRSGEGLFRPVSFVSTGRDGRYEISGLPSGRFSIRFSDSNIGSGTFETEFYDDAPTEASAEPVALEHGDVRPGIDATMEPRGGIAGRVTDESGEVLAGICVDESNIALDRGYARSTVTDSDGNYFFPHLERGDYRVHFGCSSGGDFAQEYFDDRGDFNSATAVHVSTGATSRVDADLTPAGRIEGNVTDAAGTPLGRICVDALDRSGSYAVSYTSTDGNGDYSLSSLSDGEYVIEFRDCQRHELATEYYDGKYEYDKNDATLVSARTGRTTAGVDAELSRTGSISGVVNDSSGGALKSMCIEAIDSSGEVIDSRRTIYDGTFGFSSLPVGGYRIRFSDCGIGEFLAQYWKDVPSISQATTVEVTDRSHVVGVDATLSRGGRIDGHVTADDGGPVDGVCVDAMADGGGPSIGDRAERDGGYALQNLPAGDYVIGFSDCDNGAFESEYYDDSATIGGAVTIPVSGEQTVSGIDASLRRRGSSEGPRSPSPPAGDRSPPPSGDAVSAECVDAQHAVEAATAKLASEVRAVARKRSTLGHARQAKMGTRAAQVRRRIVHRIVKLRRKLRTHLRHRQRATTWLHNARAAQDEACRR